MSIAERVEGLRRQKGWTKRELARRTALSYQQVCKVIAAQRTRLEADTIIALARAFNVSTDYLLGMDEDADADEEDAHERLQTALTDAGLRSKARDWPRIRHAGGTPCP